MKDFYSKEQQAEVATLAATQNVSAEQLEVAHIKSHIARNIVAPAFSGEDNKGLFSCAGFYKALVETAEALRHVNDWPVYTPSVIAGELATELALLREHAELRQRVASDPALEASLKIAESVGIKGKAN